MTNTPAGWYPDPYDPRQLRWWDGSQWTDSTHPLEQGAKQTVQASDTPPTAQFGPVEYGPAQSGTGPSGTAQYGAGTAQFGASSPGPPPGSTPGGPSGQFAQPGSQPPPYSGPGLWGGGKTEQLPMPDFGSQPQRNSAMPWVLGGVALLAALALILG